jgi:hypothetical protein
MTSMSGDVLSRGIAQQGPTGKARADVGWEPAEAGRVRE